MTALAAASASLGCGFCVVHTGVLIPALQKETDPNLKISLKEGSWMGK